MKFICALIATIGFVAAHQGSQDAQGNHSDSQDNIVQFSNQGGNPSAGSQQNNPQSIPIKTQSIGNTISNNDSWIQQLLGPNSNNNNQPQNNVHGHGPNEPCDHPHQGQPAYKQY